MRIVYRTFFRLPLAGACFICLFSLGAIQAQSTQLPSPTSHVSDFANVVDPQTKGRLENLLLNLKNKTKVEFYVATVDTTGGVDIFDFSRKLSSDWNVGARNSASKSLLLVVSVGTKASFTQFSKSVQSELPEGVLGEMAQRMRLSLNAGRFSEAIDQAVMFFTGALAQKLGFAAQDLEKPTVDAAQVAATTDTQQSTDTPRTRPRVVKEASKPAEGEATSSAATTEPKLPTNETTQPTATAEVRTEDVKPVLLETEKNGGTPKPIKASTTSKASKNNQKVQKTEEPEPVDDEDEAEEVELTLTLPLAKRAIKLKEFLDTHPESKARPRATELLISTHAGLGDQYLKAGDAENGIRQLSLVVEEADTAISDQLFHGVVSQIPSNLYLRGQSEAAFKAAQAIETKFGSDPKRLLTLAGFYLGLERGDEGARIAEQAVKIAPELAEAHRVLALSRHINLQLDEAAAEYKKTIELDPTSKASRSSLADLMRASGKAEEALALYNELLKDNPKDRAAEAGMVISLFELGRKAEANSALQAALTNEPRNLALLAGMAYWFAAHGDYEKSVDFSKKAIEIEPRYTWAQIALVRSLVSMKKPVGAERAMRFARQYGKFPTLNYELANVVAAMGFYDEAVEILRESFSFKDGEIDTYLAGRIPAHDSAFITLLSPERKASIYQPTPADSAATSKMLKDLLALDTSLAAGQIDDAAAAKAATQFASGDDGMKTYRQLYAASRLLRKTVALPTALRLVEDAKKGLDDALNVSVATAAVQADELRDLRANALASGTVPEMEEAPRSALSNILRGRTEDLTGWILFNQDKVAEAIDHLKRASTILPYGTPAWRTSKWHLGVAYEQTGSNSEALESYINSYNSGVRDPLRRATIEKIYQKVNGSLAGLDDRIGPSPIPGATRTEPSRESAIPRASTQNQDKPVVEAAKPEMSTATSTSSESTSTTTQPSTPPTEMLTEEAAKAASARLRSTIKITGHVLDSAHAGLANAVVVLISPSGSVISATTDNEGKFSFSVIPSQREYRLIPSKPGYTFTPGEKMFSGLLDDQPGIDFVGVSGRP